MEIISITISVTALAFSLYTFRKQQLLANKSYRLDEQKTLSDELRPHIDELNEILQVLETSVQDITGILCLELNNLLNCLPEPTTSDYASRPIRHHAYDLSEQLSNEIMAEFENQSFVFKSQRLIKLLGTYAKQDIFPAIKTKSPSIYDIYECFKHQKYLRDYAALTEVNTSKLN